jgi:hypothetical protein
MNITIGSGLSARALPNVGVGQRVVPFTACQLSSAHLHEDFLDRPQAESRKP